MGQNFFYNHFGIAKTILPHPFERPQQIIKHDLHLAIRSLPFYPPLHAMKNDFSFAFLIITLIQLTSVIEGLI